MSRNPSTTDKSVGVALTLSLFFGALGTFYVSAPAALTIIVLHLVALMVLKGWYLFLLPLAHIATVVVTCVLASRAHSRFTMGAASVIGVQPPTVQTANLQD